MMTPDAFGIRFQCRLRRRLFNDTDLIDVLSFSTTKPGIQTDEEENGGDESVGGTTGEATAGKRIILAKISEGLFFKKEKFEHPKPSRFFIKLLFPSERRRRRENFLKGAAATALQTERERKGHPLVVFERVEK